MAINAIYEHGVFRPVEPVSLPEQTRVVVEVVPPVPSSDPAWSWRSLGLVTFVAPDFEETPADFQEYLE